MWDSELEKAKRVLDELPEESTSADILLALRTRAGFDDEEAEQVLDLGSATQVAGSASGLMGCLLPLLGIALLFLLLPILFRAGEWLVPRKERVLRAGKLTAVESTANINTGDFVGKPCRVLADYVEIDQGKAWVFLPRSDVKYFEVSKD